MAMMRDGGWTVARTEHWDHYARRTKDLFGFADILAINAGESRLIQTTTADNAAARYKKICAIKEASDWLACYNRTIHVHSWGKRGGLGERKLWTVVVIEIKRIQPGVPEELHTI